MTTRACSTCLIFLLRENAQTVRHAGDELGEVDGRRSEWNATSVRPRQEQEILHQPREPVDLLEHAGDDLAMLRNGQ